MGGHKKQYIKHKVHGVSSELQIKTRPTYIFALKIME